MVGNNFPSVDNYTNNVCEVGLSVVKPASAMVKLHLRCILEKMNPHTVELFWISSMKSFCNYCVPVSLAASCLEIKLCVDVRCVFLYLKDTSLSICKLRVYRVQLYSHMQCVFLLCMYVC